MPGHGWETGRHLNCSKTGHYEKPDLPLTGQEGFLEEAFRQAPKAGQGSFGNPSVQLVTGKQGGLTGENPLTVLTRMNERPLGREQQRGQAASDQKTRLECR